MAYESLTPQIFIERYGREAPVVVGEEGRAMTLGQALDFESLSCTGDTTARQDPTKRIAYMAKMLARGGSLRPEDEHWLDQPEGDAWKTSP